jgi:hypothetical protein
MLLRLAVTPIAVFLQILLNIVVIWLPFVRPVFVKGLYRLGSFNIRPGPRANLR